MKTLNKHRAHTRYTTKDGAIVPGVTTILGILNKPALVPWANNMGLKGIDVSKYVDSKATVGTIAHYLVECDLTEKAADLEEYSPVEVAEAMNSFRKWQTWKSTRDVKLILSEGKLVSEAYRYGGTVDIYADIDGVATLLDIKTSKAIYGEMMHQVAAYRQLLVENEYPVDQVMIIRIGREDDEGFETRVVGNLEKHFSVFEHCLAIFNLQRELDR